MNYKLMCAVGAVLLLGVGCASSTPAPTPAPSPVPSTPSTSSEPTVPPAGGATSTPTPPPATSATPTTFSIDNTWKTYDNKALGFSFQWPTKGSYAPTWGVKFAQENDSAVKDDCYLPMDAAGSSATERLNVSGVNFCHVSVQEGAAGTTYLKDYFTTKKGNQYIVISFDKRAYGGDLCKEGALSSNSQVCVRFNPVDYQGMLKTIVGSFKYSG